MSSVVIENYWKMLAHLDTSSKLELIRRLSASIELPADKKTSARIFEGAWDDGETSEKLIDKIRNARTNNRKRESL